MEINQSLCTTKKEDIIELENKLLQAISTSDLAQLDSLLHKDLLFLAPTGNVITKEMDLASHKAGEMIVEQLTSTIENIKIIEDSAIVIVVYDTKGTMLGNPIEGKFRYLRVWKQADKELKVIGGSCMKI